MLFFNGCLVFAILWQVKNKTSSSTTPFNKLMLRFCFLILKISLSFFLLHLKIDLRLSLILKTSNKMVFEMVLQMVFVPNLCTVKTYKA